MSSAAGQHFLGHAPTTVADKHYVVPSQKQFDEALLWLGLQVGVEKTSAGSSRRKSLSA